MIEQRYIDILSKQKEDLLSQKRGLNFFQRIFFRKYTNWERQEYMNDPWNQIRTPIK